MKQKTSFVSLKLFCVSLVSLYLLAGCAGQIQKNQETLLKTAIVASTMWSNLAKQVLEDEAAGIVAVEKRQYLKESDPYVTELARAARAGEIPRDELVAYINGFIAKLTAWGIKGVDQ